MGDVIFNPNMKLEDAVQIVAQQFSHFETVDPSK
jgi:hypothetical protein